MVQGVRPDELTVCNFKQNLNRQKQTSAASFEVTPRSPDAQVL